jgi:hypothetical protein
MVASTAVRFVFSSQLGVKGACLPAGTCVWFWIDGGLVRTQSVRGRRHAAALCRHVYASAMVLGALFVDQCICNGYTYAYAPVSYHASWGSPYSSDVFSRALSSSVKQPHGTQQHLESQLVLCCAVLCAVCRKPAY